MCRNCDESVDRIVSGCSALAKDEYLYRHGKAVVYMHWSICKQYNLLATEKWYDHKPNTVTENDEYTILCDISVHTDRKIKANKSAFNVKGKEQELENNSNNNSNIIMVIIILMVTIIIKVKVTQKLSNY